MMVNKNSNIGRNDLCFCGSGIKFKKCCLGKENKQLNDFSRLYAQRYNILLKKKADIEGIKKAGHLAIDTLDLVEKILMPDMTTDDINSIVHEFIIKKGAIPAPLNYRGFPKSVCVSVNEVICHGIPGKRIIKNGDIVNVDVTPILNGYYADANKTFFIGTPGDEARKIVHVARKSLKKGMSAVRPGNTIGDIGWAIQTYAEKEGCSIVREYIGHGVGYNFHEPPEVPHFGKKGEGITLVPGMVFTIEPMINLGKRYVQIKEDKWTAVTQDGSLSAQFEQTLLVTENGYESLTYYEL